MAIRNIIQYPDLLLREKCKPVQKIDNRIRKILDDMAETMYQAPGIGLAASQIGITERLIVVDIGNDEETNRQGKLYKIVNPEIVEKKGITEYEEGCLSIPGIKDYVKRAAEVTLKGLDETGKEISIAADGLLAICFQHELDHLEGILFIDHLSRLKRELIKSKMSKKKRDE